VVAAIRPGRIPILVSVNGDALNVLLPRFEVKMAAVQRYPAG
jgi:hypothetical protein